MTVLAGGGWSNAVSASAPVAGITVAAGVATFSGPTGIAWTPRNGGELYVNDKGNYVSLARKGRVRAMRISQEVRTIRILT